MISIIQGEMKLGSQLTRWSLRDDIISSEVGCGACGSVSFWVVPTLKSVYINVFRCQHNTNISIRSGNWYRNTFVP